MKKYIIAVLVLMCAAATGNAVGIIKNAEINVRLGYGIGGTLPMGMPETIRHLNTYKPQFNPSLGVDAMWNVDGNWNVMAGLQLENKGMDEDARVKNYKMTIERGGQTLSGVFTGNVTTKVTEWMLTLPVQAVYKVKNVNIKFGPYVSYVGSRDFSGYAHGGYLRVDDPTGAKVELGEDEGERGDYVFTKDMRRMQFGIDLGADWHFNERFGAFFDLAWGLSHVHRSGFSTIEPPLYPVFAKFGLTYRLK